MNITEDYKNELLTIVHQYPLIHCYQPLVELISNANQHDLSREELHEAITRILKSPLPVRRLSRWARLWRFITRRHDSEEAARVSALTNALANLMDRDILYSQPLTPRTPRTGRPDHETGESRRMFSMSTHVVRTGYEDKKPWGPSRFTQEMIHANELYEQDYTSHIGASARSPLSPSLLKTIIAFIIDNYNKRFIKYEHEKNPIAKGYHCMRLLLLEKWTSPEGYVCLIRNIKRTHYRLSKDRDEKLSFDITLNDAKKLAKKHQDMLNWIAIFSAESDRSDTPDAMVFALEILALSADFLTSPEPLHQMKGKMDKFLDVLNQFRLFFIDSFSVDEININGSPRLKFIKTFDEDLMTSYNSNDFEQLLKDIISIRETLLNIYQELNMLLWGNISDHIKAIFEQQASDGEEKYQRYFDAVCSGNVSFRELLEHDKYLLNAIREKSSDKMFFYKYAEQYKCSSPEVSLLFTPNTWGEPSSSRINESESSRRSSARTSSYRHNNYSTASSSSSSCGSQDKDNHSERASNRADTPTLSPVESPATLQVIRSPAAMK